MVLLTDEIFKRKLHFLCSDFCNPFSLYEIVIPLLISAYCSKECVGLLQVFTEAATEAVL